MRRPGLFWGASLGGLILADVLLDRRHDDSTLSACTRATFRTHHPLGRVVFVGGWMFLAAWFPIHILRSQLDKLGHDLLSPGVQPPDRGEVSRPL